MQAQARICPHCKDDHHPPCSVERMARTLAEAEAENASLRAELKAMTALRDSEADRVHRVAANHDACEQELAASEEENASLRAELEAARAALATVQPRRKYELSWIDTNAFERWEATRAGK